MARLSSGFLVLVSLSMVGHAAYTPGAGPVAGNLTRGCVDKYDRARDYFPDKASIEDAVHFSVSYHGSYKVLTVAATDSGAAERYVLVQCGTPAPAMQGTLAGAQLTVVPITSLYSDSTTHLSALVDLQRLDVLTGVSTKRYLIGDEIVRRTGSAQVRAFAPASTVDTELVVSERPSVLMTSGPVGADLGGVRQAGIPVVRNQEWLEPTPLGRAEWLKYMSIFLNEERVGQRLYADVKGRYRAVVARVRGQSEARRPTVMTGRGSRGEFVIAGGRSYVAALIRDAGGRYVWADNASTGAVTVDLETQLERAADADVWINGGGWPNLGAIVQDEPRYRAFKAYRTGQVWVYERRMSAAGANDYWSRAVSHPDLILADLLKIFHPALAQDHAFQWYLQVPAR